MEINFNPSIICLKYRSLVSFLLLVLQMSLTGVAKVSKQRYSTQEISNEEITVTITNSSNNDVEVIQYLSYLNYVKGLTLNGNPLKLIDSGIRKRMREQKDTDYFTIPSGQYLDFKIRISSGNMNKTKYYDLNQTGKYEVTLNDQVKGKINGNQQNFSFVVNKVQFDIQ